MDLPADGKADEVVSDIIEESRKVSGIFQEIQKMRKTHDERVNMEHS